MGGWISAVYLLMAAVSTVYHATQPWCDDRAHQDRGVWRWLDHILGWSVFALNAVLLAGQWRRRPLAAAASTAMAALSGVLYLCPKYEYMHGLWHLSAGLGSALLAI